MQRVIKLKALSSYKATGNRYKAAGVKAGVYICKAAGAGAGVQNCKTAGAGPGAEKPEFAQDVYGAPFVVVSDHKPLEVIVNNPRHKTSLRLQRILVRLMDYDFSVTYRPGKVTYQIIHPDILCNQKIKRLT